MPFENRNRARRRGNDCHHGGSSKSLWKVLKSKSNSELAPAQNRNRITKRVRAVDRDTCSGETELGGPKTKEGRGDEGAGGPCSSRYQFCQPDRYLGGKRKGGERTPGGGVKLGWKKSGREKGGRQYGKVCPAIIKRSGARLARGGPHGDANRLGGGGGWGRHLIGSELC